MAVWLAERGLYVFRIKNGTKDVFIDKGWARGEATNDPGKVWDMWSGPFERALDYNIGIALGDTHLCADVDVPGVSHGLTDGRPAWAALDVKVSTLAVQSASGGCNRIYALVPGQRFLSNKALGHGIDVKTGNAYVLGPGSWTEERPGKSARGAYVIVDDSPIAPLPECIRVKLTPAGIRQHYDESSFGGLWDHPIALAHVKDYIEHHAPEAVKGCRGFEGLKLAHVCGDWALTKPTALEMLRQWHEHKCTPNDDTENQMEHVLDSAYATRKEPFGRHCCWEYLEAIPDEIARGAPTLAPGKLLEFARDIDVGTLLSGSANAIVKHLIAPKSLMLIYGDSTAGKTFVTLDMAMHIAHGRDWHGRRVKQGAVLYVALEGEFGFRARVAALRDFMGDPGNFFARLTVTPSLIRGDHGANGAKQIIAAYEELLRVSGAERGVIIIDTLSRAIAGQDENAAEDMMFFVQHRAGAIAETTRAGIVAVHHTNKGGTVRGSSSLIPSVETSLRVDRYKEGGTETPYERRVTAEKVKDGVEGPLFDFRLKILTLGIDPDGDVMTTCVVERVESPSDDKAHQMLAEDAANLLTLKEPVAVSKLAAMLVTRPPYDKQSERNMRRLLVSVFSAKDFNTLCGRLTFAANGKEGGTLLLTAT